MVYYVYIDVYKRNTAGLKAPADIAAICDQNGFKRFTIPPYPGGMGFIKSRIWLARTMADYISRMYKTLQPGDVMLLQNLKYGSKPLSKAIPLIRKKRKCRFVILIHDLESLRMGIDGCVKTDIKKSRYADREFLQVFDRIISHNRHMTDYLVNHNGIPSEKIVNLELFDYLTEVERLQPPKGPVPSIAIAGNLARGKCGYIYRIPEDKNALRVHLYGNKYDENHHAENVTYHGSFKPEELPEHLVGDFGLVWDGDSAETCAGNTGNYLRYNNPHKTSLYLASNMPVIVWKESAVADFVLGNGVGIAVSSLTEISDAIQAVTPEEYAAMCERVKTVSEKLRSGYFFTRAIRACIGGETE